MGTFNCKLEGNQNLIIGKVQIHTTTKGLVNEELSVTVKGKSFKVNVVEEIRDITEVDIEEVIKTNGKYQAEYNADKREENNMDISDNDSVEDSESSNEGDESEDENNEEEGGIAKEINDDSDNDIRPMERDGRKNDEDEGSRVSFGTRVGDSFEGEFKNKEEKSAQKNTGLHGKWKTNLENYVNVGNVNLDNQAAHQSAQKDKKTKCENYVKMGPADFDNQAAHQSKEKIIQESGRDITCMNNGNNEASVTLEHESIIGPEIGDTHKAPILVSNGPENNNGNMKCDIVNTVAYQNVQDIHTTEVDTGRINTKGKRREFQESSPKSNGSIGKRSMKKRKTNELDNFEGNKCGNTFAHGVGDEVNSSHKKPIGGRRSVKKAKKIARCAGVAGLGEVKKGISDAYKEYYEENDDNRGVFEFKAGGRVESDNTSCSINMDQVKEIGEMIGVSWEKAEKEKIKDAVINVGADDETGAIHTDQQGIGEAGKIRWVKSIIKEECPDVIGLQETKSGVVDEMWIEELWGGRGFGFTQLAANGNSGGMILIWNESSFTCKEAMGDERFIAVKGEWKGKSGDVYLVTIYGPHVGRQKASLWERLSRFGPFHISVSDPTIQVCVSSVARVSSVAGNTVGIS
ncbi:hypothetical protein CTI12_AA160700 [Artemisia annua]|uniref:RNA-directed DNA polymerase, eukaryota, Reverse transcriptase zinc-binding domain protein n=1 Tax=Artemisia annua TaxID=35608 RepID=A0A2U1PEH7_ARTAN|nr:hypothetical protein CTI12_AA160700 [Artemisia annua]